MSFWRRIEREVFDLRPGGREVVVPHERQALGQGIGRGEHPEDPPGLEPVDVARGHGRVGDEVRGRLEILDRRPDRDEPVSTRSMLASGPSLRSRSISAQVAAKPGPPVQVDDPAQVPRGFARWFVAGPGCFRARGGSTRCHGSLLRLLGGLDFQVAQILGLAGGDGDVHEQVAKSLESGAGVCAVLEAGDQALDQEPAVVADPDALVPVGAGKDVVSLRDACFRSRQGCR